MDRKGVMGFPMRMMLAFILLALCVPALSSMAEGFQDNAAQAEMDGELEKITEAADRVFYGGSGTSAIIYIDVTSGYEISIGGEDEDSYSLALLSCDGIVEKRYMEHPSVRFLGGTFPITGSMELRLTCENDGVYGVRVSEA